MDSDRRSAQVERLEVVDTGRRRRWSEDEKLKIVLESLQARARLRQQRGGMAAAMATLVPAGAEGCCRSTWLCTSDSGRGSRADAWSSRAGQQRGDRDRVCDRGSEYRSGEGRLARCDGG